MELSFNDRSLRQICENKEDAIEKFGEYVAEQLQNRLSDLFSIEIIDELITGKPQKCGETGINMVKIDLTNGYKMTVCPNHVRNPLLENGDVDWSTVTRIKIINIDKEDE